MSSGDSARDSVKGSRQDKAAKKETAARGRPPSLPQISPPYRGGLRKWEVTASHLPYLNLRYSRTNTDFPSAWLYAVIVLTSFPPGSTLGWPVRALAS